MGQTMREQVNGRQPDRAASRAAGVTANAGELLEADEVGHGGYYEIVIELGSHSRDRLLAAFDALWTHTDLAPVEAKAGTLRRRGKARLPDGALVPALAFTETMRDQQGQTDYLIFALPMPALEKACSLVADMTPAGGLDPHWRRDLEAWLASLGRHVDESVSFQAAYIGFLPFPIGDVETAAHLFAGGVPAERCVAYLYRRDDALEFFPTTRWS
ncbi:hypothetical protein [Parvibaculum sp.]|uniref:hypothetical protein n=1 Tax=Parvibaculum sp. TaxID=2024848 RepID=UPI00320CBC19